jgi:NAD(P)H-dependent flavin oxidoreductase YrpB (nitropropane dioxygenase family)
VTDLLARLGLERPVLQAGMGGGLATSALAIAVSDAGGLGTIGILPPDALREEIATVRAQTPRPLAVNLIVPLARRAHWEIASLADVVVTHWEASPRRRTPKTWIHTVGSDTEALAAVAAGADAVIAQGVEAGGHVRGGVPALELLDHVLRVVGPRVPVIVAGGIAGAADVRNALEAGAAAAVAGTAFLATEESGALAGYKARLVRSDETVLTELFGMGWPRAPHRVLHNGATRRWLTADDPRGPAVLRAVHAALGPASRLVPMHVQMRIARRVASGALDLTPVAPIEGMSSETVDTHPLYAGETVARIAEVRPAAAVVGDLTP